MAQVEAGKIVLPAMERPFVWKDDRITKLVDSLLSGFPIGTALLWKTATMQRFRRFRKDVQLDGGITVDFHSDQDLVIGHGIRYLARLLWRSHPQHRRLSPDVPTESIAVTGAASSALRLTAPELPLALLHPALHLTSQLGERNFEHIGDPP